MKLPHLMLLTLAPCLAKTATAQDRSAPPKPVAVIAEIEGQTVTLRTYEGRTRSLLLRSVVGLKVGQHTTWCEEDCRELNVWVPFAVERARVQLPPNPSPARKP